MGEKKITPSKIVIHIFFIVLTAIFIIPLTTIISVSLSTEEFIVEHGYSIFPRIIDFSAYEYVFKNPEQIINGYKVTIFNSVVGTFIGMAMMLACAYTLSRRSYPYRKILSFYIFFTMLFSGGMIPNYILITRYLHLQNTIWVLIIEGLVGAWWIFVLRAFIQDIDEAIIESAYMDGASEFRIFISLITPMSKPAIATIGLFLLLRKWNAWMPALLYIDNKDLYPLQYLLQKILREIDEIKRNMDNMPAAYLDQQDLPSETVRMALAMVAAGPMLFIMPFFQKYFVRGIRVGSVKG